MSIIRERAKNNFPMVLLTLLSIVQALALELLWDQIHQHPELYTLTFEALLGWIQALTNLLGIILIWMGYATNAMRFRWVPSSSDSLFPFLVGVLEFTMIDNLGLANLPAWLFALAALYAAMTAIAQHDMTRARQHAENAEFFNQRSKAKLSDFYLSIGSVLGLIFLGILVLLSDYNTLVVSSSIVFSFILILWQLHMTDVFWKWSMSLEDKDASGDN